MGSAVGEEALAWRSVREAWRCALGVISWGGSGFEVIRLEGREGKGGGRQEEGFGWEWGGKSTSYSASHPASWLQVLCCHTSLSAPSTRRGPG